ncbi:uncharacterized protein BCR38DRAFT_402951 [Pseudomassariella vexata]|uniref:Zn(2)-C6 fungal-type domain-containing protein n=1 Tax=Pseudomassariella vexata TaxID=1141098 RepID=A0A1Y2D9M7_9PEZI|nr:uncharacterized protein BCR38DRAFT_402951 [Pseudomassariella vexata]ORY55884.1 hypothetical protein BCR38DRAFT_402951 [Pseudomassariella vexata]
MDKPRSAASSIAKWGAACAACATAKAKCIRSVERPGAKCDRCERLDKECLDQVHKPRKKRQSKPSKTAQLEERLNSLVELIKASNSGGIPASTRTVPSITEDTSCIPTNADSTPSVQHGGSVTCNISTPSTYSSVEPPRTVPTTYNQYAPPRCICRAPVGEAPLPVESDETLLSIFVTKLSPQYPFVVLRPGISAQELESTRPFLFATIRMVASVRHLSSMRAQSYPIMKHISENMLMGSQRSLELLQAILLVVGWYHYHCMMHSQLNNLTALANSLAADMGLNRSPELQERTRILVLNPEQPKARTNDERRALCGVWYINSVVSLAFQRVETLTFTPYMKQCVQDLETDREYETDVLLVQLVRIQHLSDRIAQVHAKDQHHDDLPGIPRAPLTAYLNAFQTELDKYKAQIPRHLRSQKILLAHLHTATLRLWEPPIVDPALMHNLSNSFTSMSIGAASTLDVFYRSNAAIKTWFEFWLSIEATDYFYVPMAAFSQLIVAITMISRWAKLSSLDPPPSSSSSTSNSNASAQQGASLASRSVFQGLSDPSSKPNLKPLVSSSSSRFGSRSGGSPSSAEIEATIPATQRSDPTFPAAIASIQQHILSQPELHIDVIGVLGALVSRFEEARAEISALQARTTRGVGGAEGVGIEDWDDNIWDLAAKKISVTRLKLERWAEIVGTLGGEGLLARNGEYATGPAGTRAGPMEGVEVAEAAAGAGASAGLSMGAHPHQHQQDGGTGGWQYNNIFANDLFEGLGLDQNFFYDDAGDYGTIVLNSLGPHA